MKYYLLMMPVSQDHTECQVCGNRKDTTFWLADVLDVPEEYAAIELCDECRDKVLVSQEE